MPGPGDLPRAGVPPEEAIAFFRRKGYRIGFNWQDVFKGEHARAFTVAKAMSRDVLEDIRAEVDRAIAEGTTLDEFRRTLRPKLEARGWWGRKRMIDPATGEARDVQLGSARRLRTIFDTNLRTAYAAGKWERIERTKAAFPYLEYTSVMDGRERPEHHAWDGTILPVDDPWWETHYPPCDWNCRCSVVQRSRRMLERQGKQVTDTPARNPDVAWTNTRTGETGVNEAGIGKGWDYNVGKEQLRGLAPRPTGPAPAGSTRAPPPPTRAQEKLFDRFAAHFAVAPGREGVWTDREGHPLAIGRGWFIGADGATRLPGGSAGVVIDRIAQAITAPDTIEHVWSTATATSVLMRRYMRTHSGITTTVEVGGGTWRWKLGPARPFTRSDSLTAATRRPTAAERHAIERYTGAGYSAINRHLRGLPRAAEDVEDDVTSLIDALDSVLATSELLFDAQLWRGVSGAAVDAIEAMQLEVGFIFEDPGYWSTSKDWVSADRFARGRGLVFAIRAKAGTRAMDVTRESAVGTGEYEILFPRGAKWRVLRIDAGRSLIEVETVE